MAPQDPLHPIQILWSDQSPFYLLNSDPRGTYLGQQKHINEVQSLGLRLGLGLKEVINILIGESAAPLLDDGICKVVHQAAGPAEAPPIRGEEVQEVGVQEDLLVLLCHKLTELQDGGDIFTGLPTGWKHEGRQQLKTPEAQKPAATSLQELRLQEQMAHRYSVGMSQKMWLFRLFSTHIPSP